MSRVDELKQRLARIPDPDSPEGKKLIDDITDIAMKHRRERIINSPKTGKPYRMREDITTPLINEVPFGPNTRQIENLKHGDPKNYEISMPFKDKKTNKSVMKHLPHGGISIPSEQKRKVIPFEKRDWEKGKLKARSKRTRQRDMDAVEIALDVMNDEKPSRFVNRNTKKIRPPKPVRSDFAGIITAKLKQRLSRLQQ